MAQKVTFFFQLRLEVIPKQNPGVGWELLECLALIAVELPEKTAVPCQAVTGLKVKACHGLEMI